MEQQHAESEWVLRAYTRSTKKSKLAEDGAKPAAK
jgi:U3 small nucleolar ribonucleoprotein protein IMP4